MALALEKFEHTLKRNGILTIAHISDLHLNAETTLDTSHLVALQQEIMAAEADLLFVTGDIADNPLKDTFVQLWNELLSYTSLDVLSREAAKLNSWQGSLTRTFETALGFFKELCVKAAIKYPECVCVIPGNHDSRIQGIIPKKGGWFSRVEAKAKFLVAQGDKTFSHVFGELARDRLLVCRDSKGASAMNLAILCFDSNDTDVVLNFATGKVRDEDLARLRQFEADAEFQQAYKIVLLHHHPMPIPESENAPGVMGVLENDQFNLLKNAGIVMRELVHSGVHLVLHGHKHYSGFSSVSYPLASNTKHEISIVGAGSAGVYCEGYNFNLIELGEDGSIRVRERRRDRGGGYYSKRKFWLVDYEKTRLHRYHRLVESQGKKLYAHAEKLLYAVTIEKNGDALAKREFVNLRSISGSRSSLPYAIRTVTGYVGYKEKPRTSYSSKYYSQIEWKPLPEEPAVESNGYRLIHGELCFSPDLSDKVPVNVSVETFLCNAFDFVKEHRRSVTKGKEETESAGFDVTQYELEKLVIIVSFPEEYDFQDEKIRMKVLNSSGETDLPEWEYVSKNLVLLEDRRTALVSIPFPLPGFRYRVEWDLMQEEKYERNRYKALNPSEQSKFQGYTDLLLKPDVVRKPVSKLLSDLKGEIIGLFQKLEKPAGLEDLEISLMIPDKERLYLHVAGATFPEEHQSWKWTLPWGTGTAGQAYRRAESIFFSPYGEDNSRQYYVRPTGADKDHEVLWSVPVKYPFRNDLTLPERQTLGILNLGSYLPGSSLLQLASGSDEGVSEEERKDIKALREALVDFINGIFAKRLAEALDGLRQ